MAGYRPKSLDELNNLYGKAISAENEIKKSSSLLKEEVLTDIIGGERSTKEKKPSNTPERIEQRGSGFSGDIDAFIREFSGEKGASSISETVSKKPAPIPPQPPRPVFERPQYSERKNEGEKQENLSGLMNDYARIMSGEDDDEDDENEFYAKKSIFKNRRSEKKAKKKNSRDIIQDISEPLKEEEPKPEAEPVPEVRSELNAEPESQKLQEASVAEKPASNDFGFSPFEKAEAPAENSAETGFEPYESAAAEPNSQPYSEPYYEQKSEREENSILPPQGEASPLPEENNQNQAKQESFDEAFERIPDEDDNFVFGSAEAPRSSGGVIFAKVLLSVLLAVTLLATVLTGVCVFSVNSERSLPGGILTFCATNSYEDAQIHSNDFIICKKQDYVNDGERVIFINRELRSFSFGVKNGEKTDVSGDVYYTVSSEQIEKNDVLGVIVKTVPSFGKFVRIVVENYLLILLGLVVLAVILTLILCLAFRKRRYADDFYDEFYSGEESEQLEAPFEPEAAAPKPEESEAAEDDFDSDSLYSGIE